jgi:hypothetical protein
MTARVLFKSLRLPWHFSLFHKLAPFCAILEGTSSPQICARDSFYSYPSMFVLRGLHLTTEYIDWYEVPNIRTFLRRLLDLRVMVLETLQSVQNYRKSHPTWILLAGDDIDADFMDTFNSVADNLSDRFPFAICSNFSSVSFLSHKDFPFLSLFRIADNTVFDFPLLPTAEPGDLKSWILDRLEPRFQPG